ncbi:MAG: DUF3006 domain-containing protein [Bacillus sp. (in: firmicutes)]
MELIVDRLEGKLAVCERPDKTMINIPIEELPSGIKAGDVISSTKKGYVIDKDTTEKRRKRIEELMKDLWE